MRILIAGATGEDYLGYLSHYCQKALERLGLQTSIFDVRKSSLMTSKPLTTIEKTVKRNWLRSLRKIPAVNIVDRIKMNQRFLTTILDMMPDIVFVLNIERLHPRILLKIRKNRRIKLACWFNDPLTSLYHLKVARQVIDSFDYFFMVDSLEVGHYVKISARNIHWFPLACDPELHKQVPLTPEEERIYSCDICFVGTMFPDREKILKDFLEFKLKIWGPPVNIYGPWLKKDSPLRNAYQGRSVWGQELVKVYNASKIILDIHTQHGKPLFSVTQRVFEASACGGFVLAEKSDCLSRLYQEGREMIFYGSQQELKEKICFYLDHASLRQTIACQGQERTLRDHTYQVRLKQMLEIMS